MMCSTRHTTLDDRAPPGKATQKPRRCSACGGGGGVGTFDMLDRKWYCVSCGFDALDGYEDHLLAQHLRFLRTHALTEKSSAATYNSFRGYSDPTCYCGSFNFPPEAHVTDAYCRAVAFFFWQWSPLFHMEVIGTGARQFCEDVDIVCTDNRFHLEIVAQDDFLSLRMALMQDIYPSLQPLLLHVYSSSGFSYKLGDQLQVQLFALRRIGRESANYQRHVVQKRRTGKLRAKMKTTTAPR